MRWARLAAGAGVLLAACDVPPDWGVARAPLGQPNGDFPNYDERVVLYATNRARIDPAAEGWPAYPAQSPLQWNLDLNRSARAHSQDMHDTPCFQHNSCNGTDLFVRIKSFYTGPWMAMGENISAGKVVSDGLVAVHNWLFEIGAAPGETGHRDNIFSSKYTLLGAGFVAGGTQFQNYWTQDFVGTAVARPRLVDGIHFPATVAASSPVTFATTYFDTGGAGPAQIAVVVDGACAPLALVRGVAARGAYEAKQMLATGCHQYFFLSTTGASKTSYPDTGALQVAVGVATASCPLAVATRAADGCGADPSADGGASDDGGGGISGGGGDGAGGSSSVPGAGGSTEPGGAGGATSDDAGIGASDDAAAVVPRDPDDNQLISSTFGCAVAGDHQGRGVAAPVRWALLVTIAGVLWQRRRRARR